MLPQICSFQSPLISTVGAPHAYLQISNFVVLLHPFSQLRFNPLGSAVKCIFRIDQESTQLTITFPSHTPDKHQHPDPGPWAVS